VNVAHLCLRVGKLCCLLGLRLGGEGVSLVGLGRNCFKGCCGLLFSSCWYSSLCNWQMFSLLYRNLVAAYLCGMIGCVVDDSVAKCGFSIDGSFYVSWSFVDGYV
jgi:hypothetical protein